MARPALRDRELDRGREPALLLSLGDGGLGGLQREALVRHEDDVEDLVLAAVRDRAVELALPEHVGAKHLHHAEDLVGCHGTPLKGLGFVADHLVQRGDLDLERAHRGAQPVHLVLDALRPPPQDRDGGDEGNQVDGRHGPVREEPGYWAPGTGHGSALSSSKRSVAASSLAPMSRLTRLPAAAAIANSSWTWSATTGPVLVIRMMRSEFWPAARTVVTRPDTWAE